VAWWLWLILVIVLAALVVAGILAYRLRLVRRAGTPVIFRRLPAASDQGWRHGSMHYSDYSLVYYRLTSLRIGPSAVLARRRMEIVGRRPPEGTEREIMSDEAVILRLSVTDGPGMRKLSRGARTRRGGSGEYELSLEPELVTGLQSWIEARSPSRARWRRAA